MESVKATSQTPSQQGVTTPQPAPAQNVGSTEFGAFLQGVLKPDSANKVSEEDLFSAIVQERIKKLKGEDTLKKFQETLQQTSEAVKKPDGFIPHEDATKAALQKLREEGALSAEETDSIYSQAFAAAQLDDNKEALYDSRGGKNDPTIAVAELEQALLAARVMIEKFDDGSETASIRSVDEPSTGKAMVKGSSSPGGHGSDSFLWKPVSTSDGKLIVLLPAKLTGLATGVKLYDPAGALLATGRFTSNGNGGRNHYRFSKPGAEFPDGVKVEVSLSTGEKIRYSIRDSAERTEDIQPDSPYQNSGNDSNSSGGTGANSNDTSSGF